VYIPGKVLLVYQEWNDACGTLEKKNCSGGGNTSTERGPGSSSREQLPDPTYICRVTDGLAFALQTFEIDGFRCLGDHTTAAYEACLRAVDGLL
jgi:hypothetical protein